MEKAYKYRIYPNKQQEELIQKTFGCCRFVYNTYLAKRIKLYEESKKSLSYVQCANDMKKLKSELEWLKEVDSTALQYHNQYACDNKPDQTGIEQFSHWSI